MIDFINKTINKFNDKMEVEKQKNEIDFINKNMNEKDFDIMLSSLTHNLLYETDYFNSILNVEFDKNSKIFKIMTNNENEKSTPIKIDILINEFKNSTNEITYNKIFKINDKEINIKEFQVVVPNLYKKLFEDIKGVLNIVDLRIDFEKQEKNKALYFDDISR